MAQFTRTHGDYQPVLWLDEPEYTTGAVNLAVIGKTVQPQGPKLQYCTINKASGGWTATQFDALVKAVQQLATIYIYEFQEDAVDHLAVAFYPYGAWGPDITDTGPGTLDQAVTDATGAACTVTNGATFTN